jgi:hypothetical protein
MVAAEIQPLKMTPEKELRKPKGERAEKAMEVTMTKTEEEMPLDAE